MTRGAVKHGTPWAYQGRECRCPECREGEASRRREIRRRKRGVPNPSEPECPWCRLLWSSQLSLGVHMASCPFRPAGVS